MSRYTTQVEDEYGNEHEVVVLYQFSRPQGASYDSPPEGGFELLDITCPIRLSQCHVDRIIDRASAYAYSCYYEGGYND